MEEMHMKIQSWNALRASVLASMLVAVCGQAQAVTFRNSNLTMLDADGLTFGGTNDVAGSWDGTLNTAVDGTNFNMNLGSDTPFFGIQWTLHHVRVFGPGSYSFDSSCSVAQIEGGMAACGGGPALDLTVGDGQLGAHALFDWNQTENIDMAFLWDVNGVFTSAGDNGTLFQGAGGPTPAPDTIYSLVSRDVDADGIAGAAMVDGEFIGFSPNFNLRQVPLPAVVWLFASGLVGLAGVARRDRV
jgi:hypothetical protein